MSIPEEGPIVWITTIVQLYHNSLVDYLALSDISKKLSHHILVHFPIGIGSYDCHKEYQGVFMDLL